MISCYCLYLKFPKAYKTPVRTLGLRADGHKAFSYLSDGKYSRRMGQLKYLSSKVERYDTPGRSFISTGMNSRAIDKKTSTIIPKPPATRAE